MSLDDAVKLIGSARAVYPAMTIVPGIADAWHGLLGDLSLTECMAALHRHGRTEARIPAPADIRRLAISARADLPPAAVETIDAARALRSADASFAGLPIPGKPAWAQGVYEAAKARQREINAERKANGQLPTFGIMVKHHSDGRIGR